MLVHKFMGYFVVSGLLSEYFIQAYLVGGFLLIPFQILALIAATLVVSKVRKLIGSNSDPEFIYGLLPYCKVYHLDNRDRVAVIYSVFN